MIELTIADDIAEVVLNAPEKRNAVDASALQELADAYTQAERAGVRALVLRGEGKGFCAGRDIAQVDPATDDAMGFMRGTLQPLLEQIAAFPAPTFAVAHGACLGIGLGLLVATDVVYVAESAKLGSPFAALGATLDSGGHALFFERLGAHRAFDLIYSGRLMSGAEAVAAGLFSQAFPDDEVLAATRAAAAHAAQGPTLAFWASKEIIRGLRDERQGLWRSVDAENAAQAALSQTADFREGFAAFQQKRQPRFTGRG
ncbi:enoyl-CoA hydratase/isomerase family protein [Agrococcus baldri]|uniref:2-(1,2-epoxy-1,2-dihydrophenyl)acetyl-CoA isomerase n=1 Tax=Agrococcus baldri TaxID=153730 RepID=A0AA87RBX3_9MICO|nr:enoyl-CoA hydratase-related protein [Agrococcus baldri]GEK79986.1 2-(1,2-epoxy-1,2-dihydrophenyl)acetyl-CoA isomerase [Agrococcus baldri]